MNDCRHTSAPLFTATAATVPSGLPSASVRPSGLKDNALVASGNGWGHISFHDAVSNIRAPPAPPIARAPLSALYASVQTSSCCGRALTGGPLASDAEKT